MFWSLLRCVSSRKCCSYTCLHIFCLTKMLMRNPALMVTVRNSNNYWTPERKWFSGTDLSAGLLMGQIIHARSFEGLLTCIQLFWMHPAALINTQHTRARAVPAKLLPSIFCFFFFFGDTIFKSLLSAIRMCEVLDLMGLQFTASAEMYSSFVFGAHGQLRAPYCAAVCCEIDTYLKSPPETQPWVLHLTLSRVLWLDLCSRMTFQFLTINS